MPDERRSDRLWSYSAGEYGATVRVFERTPGGNIYVTANGVTPRSLGHADRERAKDYADEEAKKLRKGLDGMKAGRPTVARVFRLYRAHRVPEKSEKVQGGDERRMTRWRRHLGLDFDLRKLSRRGWDSYERKRRSGAMDAKGEPVPDEDERREVGDRVIEKDLAFLRSVCRWATDWRDDAGRLLLASDPTRGLPIPHEKNPKRPVATNDRVDAIRAVATRIKTRAEIDGKRRMVESTLPEVFDLVVGTGRRIGAVLRLRREDLELERRPATPHGAIVWPADTDKMGRRWRCPISARVREAVESALRKRRRRGRVGAGPLFPRPGDADKPLYYSLASSWLRRAEELAGVEPHEGSLWHAYRRLWVTVRKELPDVDLMQTGGWKSHQALRSAYQRPDDATMLRVVEHDAELREIR